MVTNLARQETLTGLISKKRKGNPTQKFEKEDDYWGYLQMNSSGTCSKLKMKSTLNLVIISSNKP